MKENEFDIYVRDLMAGAEESVSPEAWKGVAAGLDKAARRRAVPLWVWRSVAGVAAAAAVVAGIVLFAPEKNLSNQPTIPIPVAQATDDPLPVLNEPEGEAITSIEQQVTRLRSVTAYVPEIPVVEEDTVTVEEVEEEAVPAELERKPETVIAPATQQDGITSDEEAYNRLAFEEYKTRQRGSFSTGIQGNIQSNTRPQSPTSTIRRSPGMFFTPEPTKTGLFDERPEFSFGLPVSAGISLRYDFGPRWGLGTGIVYTNLTRSFMARYANVDGDEPFITPETDVTNQQHYLGIPLNLYFNIVNTGFWNFHLRMDGMAEKLISNDFLVHDSAGDIRFNQPVDKFQYSAGIGLGVEFKFTPYLGIYLDPTLRYYFDCGQPRSIRTIQPLRMDFEAGLRFSLGR